MKQTLRLLRYTLVAILSMVTGQSLYSQAMPQSPIGVDIPGSGIKYFPTLDEAFSATKKANKDGCTIYIPSGVYSLSGHDSIQLNRRVNIFGAGARGSDKTMIITTMDLPEGTDGSVIQGLRLNSGASIKSNNVLLKNIISGGTISFSSVTRDNLMESCWFLGGNAIEAEGTNLTLRNSVIGFIQGISGGLIDRCIVYSGRYVNNVDRAMIEDIYQSTITNSILFGASYIRGGYFEMKGCVLYKSTRWIPEDAQVYGVEDLDIQDFFVKLDPNGSWSPELYDLNLKSDSPAKGKGVNGSDPGIYGGDGFDDKMMAPVPRIVITDAPVKTNEQGKLVLKVRIDQN